MSRPSQRGGGGHELPAGLRETILRAYSLALHPVFRTAVPIAVLALTPAGAETAERLFDTDRHLAAR